MNLLRNLLLLSVCLASAAYANDHSKQSLQVIQQVVHDFLLAEHANSQEVQIDVKSLDKRLRLAACDNDPATEWSPGSQQLGRVTVQVSCASPKPWRVHVQARVAKEGYAWVVARAVKRGEILSEATVTRESIRLGSNGFRTTTLGNPIDNITPWLGYEFTQSVQSGRVLSDRMLKPPTLVFKGEQVVVVHRSQGLELQTKGTAMGNAPGGERVRVKNQSSGKVIEATVIARGLVQVVL